MPSQNPLFIKIGKNLCKIENICYFCKHINAKTMKEPINTHPMQQQPTAVRKASMMAGSSQEHWGLVPRDSLATGRTSSICG